MMNGKIEKFALIAVVATLTVGMLSVATLAGYGSEKKSDKPDIVDIAANDSRFSTLVAAVKAAGLVDTLKSEGPFTVLAPTNEAFQALPEGTLETLLKPENKDQLTAILTYHVIPAKAKAKDVVKLSEVTTVQGSDIDIAVRDGNVMLNGTSQVIVTDVMASNGVIHAIDSVLLPPTD